MKRFASQFMPYVLLCAIACFLPNSLCAQDQPAAQKPAPVSHSAAAHAGHLDPNLLHPAMLKAKAPDVYEATFTTTKGDFVVQVTRAWSPLGADRFYNLVKHGFYNDMRLFRVASGFVVQFGLSGNASVNKAWENANIQDDPVTQSNTLGTITFATAGANTRTTEVFINLGDNARLDNTGFAPFGKVTSGMDVIQQFYSGYGETPTSAQDKITEQGNAYLDKTFPKLDSIKTATITSPASDSGAAAKKAPAPKP